MAKTSGKVMWSDGVWLRPRPGVDRRIRARVRAGAPRGKP